MRHRATFLAMILGFALTLGAVSPPAKAQETGTLSGVISDAATGDPLAGAEVFVQGTQRKVATDSAGRYSLTLPAGQYSLLIHRAGYVAASSEITLAAGGEEIESAALDKDNLFTEEIVVVGTRRSDRTVIQSPVPIDVIPAEEIEQTGLTETNQILEMLVPSYNFPRPTVTDGTDHVRPATLRGLSPDQTLVLINGKRRHTTALLNVNGSIGRGSSPVDLNQIPANAIERIEVLRDGAAAQYGSDAIAGVINIVLKADSGIGFSATAGETDQGDGGVVQMQGNYGATFGQGGFVHVSGEYRDRDPTNRSGADPRQQYFSLPDGSPDPREASFDRINHRYGDAEVEDLSLFINSGFPVGGDKFFYAFGNFGNRNGEAGGFYRRALDNRTIRAIYPDGFLPLIESEVDDTSLTAGLKGTAASWLWDVSATHGENDFQFNVNNSANVSLGTASPTNFDAGTLSFTQTTFNADVFRDFEVGLRTPLSLALGLEYRDEGYEIQAGEDASWIDGGVPVLDGPNAGAIAAAGSQVFPGFRPADVVDASRDNVAVYADLEADLTDKLSVSVAGRFEDFSDFGSTASGKVAMRFEAVEKLAFRAAISNGFRAPSLAQSFYSTSSTVFISGDPFEIRTFPVNDPAARALGAEDLDPEESINISAGIATNPYPNFYLTLDYYQIDIDDRIVLSENIRGSAVRALLEAQGFPGQDGGRFFTNAIDTRTEGLDLVARYAHELGGDSRLRLTLGYNLNDVEVTRVADNPPELAGLNAVLFGRSERGRIEEGQPEDKINLSVGYDRGKFSGLLRSTRFGEVTNRHSSDPTRDQTFSAKWVTDLDLSYHLTSKLKLAIGGNNVFDVFPDENIARNSFNGIFVYNSVSPFGFNGAYYYTRLSVKVR